MLNFNDKKGGEKKKYGPANCKMQQSPINIKEISQKKCGAKPANLNLCSFHIHDNEEHKGIGCDGKGKNYEAHWVYTSCPVDDTTKPAWGLEKCAPANCKNPIIHVVGSHLNVGSVDNSNITKLKPPSDNLYCYKGSTTSSKYNSSCSQIPVNWRVRNKCIPLSNDNFNNLLVHNKSDYSIGLKETLATSRNVNEYHKTL
tara:strand:+ start:81 stop:680 length:600 start_codon:yes stop_codon:yes gene_type:complete